MQVASKAAKMADDLWINNSRKVLSDGFRNSISVLSFSILLFPFRVNVASVARMDLRGKEGSKVEWDCQGHKET